MLDCSQNRTTVIETPFPKLVETWGTEVIDIYYSQRDLRVLKNAL